MFVISERDEYDTRRAQCQSMSSCVSAESGLRAVVSEKTKKYIKLGLAALMGGTM